MVGLAAVSGFTIGVDRIAPATGLAPQTVAWVYALVAPALALAGALALARQWAKDRWPYEPGAAELGGLGLALLAVAGAGTGAYAGLFRRFDAGAHLFTIVGYFLVAAPSLAVLAFSRRRLGAVVLRQLAYTLGLEVGAQVGNGLARGTGPLSYWDDITAFDGGFLAAGAFLAWLVARSRG